MSSRIRCNLMDVFLRYTLPGRVRTLRSGFDGFGQKPHRSAKRLFGPASTNPGHVVWERGGSCSVTGKMAQIRVGSPEYILTAFLLHAEHIYIDVRKLNFIQ